MAGKRTASKDKTGGQAAPRPAVEFTPDMRRRQDSIDRFFDRPIFIGGMGRSGTSLLLRLFDGHPEIFVVPDESTVLTHAIPSYLKSGDPKAAVNIIAQRVRRMMRKARWREAGVAHLAAALPPRLAAQELPPRAAFRVLLQSLALEHATDGKRMWLEKTPKNEMHLGEIFHSFPKARIIFNIRDPRAVYASMKKGNLKDITPVRVGGWWARRVMGVLEYISKHRGSTQRILLSRYEDYVANPDQAIPKLLGRLGLDPAFSPQPTFMGAPWRGNSWDESSNVSGEIVPGKIGSWRSELTAEEIDAIAAQASFEMAMFGYEP